MSQLGDVMTGSQLTWLSPVVDDPTILLNGIQHLWSLLNCFRMAKGHCVICQKKCGLTTGLAPSRPQSNANNRKRKP